MKVEVSEKPVEQKSEYPKLMISKKSETHPDRIVLFLSNKIGVCLSQPNNEEYSSSFIGEYYEHWLTDAFTPFTGSITLSND